ncbi:MAG: hypothetical protein M0R77_13000 [Gammaproteobacteria bacterium]|nr:hypothetical protein [Gammaproteobacteria bacterium]
MSKISRSLIIGACMIAPGGLIALTALAVVDKETRKKLIDMKDQAINYLKERGNDKD